MKSFRGVFSIFVISYFLFLGYSIYFGISYMVKLTNDIQTIGKEKCPK